MENKETAINESNKVTETLTKELESLSNEELHEFFKLYFAKSYKSSIIQQLIRMKKVKTSVEYGKSG